ncbi:hypothetical protein FF1_043870 [Malus domestica]
MYICTVYVLKEHVFLEIQPDVSDTPDSIQLISLGQLRSSGIAAPIITSWEAPPKFLNLFGQGGILSFVS